MGTLDLRINRSTYDRFLFDLAYQAVQKDFKLAHLGDHLAPRVISVPHLIHVFGLCDLPTRKGRDRVVLGDGTHRGHRPNDVLLNTLPLGSRVPCDGDLSTLDALSVIFKFPTEVTIGKSCILDDVPS